MQNLTQLQHFKLVAREGSFARAADLAHITQPALSNSIRSLERRLGFQLFERSERPVRLTPVGKSILDRVDALLFEARNLDQMLENLSIGKGGQLRVGMTAVFSTSLGGPILAEWHARHPDVKLNLIIDETTRLVHGLREEVYDFIVGDARDLREDIDDLNLIEMPPQAGGAFCRSGHPILTIRRPQPSDLARYRFAGTHFPKSVARAFTSFVGRQDRAGPPIVAIDSHNIAALRDAVAESDLILLTTSGCVRNELALGILHQIPVELGINGVWSVVTRRGRVLQPAAQKLIEKIIEIAAREHDHRLHSYAHQFAIRR